MVYLGHFLLFGNWIIDDAGISFAYSRNLAQGYGLVSQPGLEPVEGYSSFTWVLIFVPFFLSGVFDPVYIPKAVSILLVLLSFITLSRIIKLISSYPLAVTFLSLLLLSLNTSFVVWTCSGLENPLYLFLAVLLLYQLIKHGESLNLKNSFALAIIAALLAATRPDGVIFVLVLVIYLFFNYLFWKEKAGITFKNPGIYASVFIMLFGSFLLFRVFYFQDLFPNTYYAKGGPSINDIRDITLLKPRMYGKLYELFNGAYAIWGIFLLGYLIIIPFYLMIVNEFTRKHLALILFLFSSILVYILLPPDWMGEFRFAILFYPFFYLSIFIFGENLFRKMRFPISRRIILASFLILIMSGPPVYDFLKRSKNFRENPTVPFQMIAEEYSARFGNYASILKLDSASILLPDAGGILFNSKLRVYDLAGLTDKIIARTLLKKQKDFYDYVFESAKPVFIHTHGVWAYRADFYSDNRFLRDYMPLKEDIDSRMIKKYKGLRIYTGEYIRRDAVKGKTHLLKIVQSSIKDSDKLVQNSEL